jgi:sigma-B regulation protein RsbU (phosphoserine phosphatase)
MRLIERASSADLSDESFVSVTSDATHNLIQTLFSGTHRQISMLRYATAYKVAEGHSGGDVVDVFHYNNDHVSFVVADVAGKGNKAAVQAAMIKYGLRTLASNGLMPESVMVGLNRLYQEQNAFENNLDSFATVFFGVTDATRRFLYYSNAGHEPVILVQPDGAVNVLAATCPLIGIFGDQNHLFKQSTIDLSNGSLLVATTDGVTEARNEKGEQFGMKRFIATVVAHRTESESDIAQSLLAAAEEFCNGNRRDDIGIVVSRFLS